MNKLSVLVFSLALVAFSAFSTASAQDIKASWLEYQNARNLLIESNALATEAKNQISAGQLEMRANADQAQAAHDLTQSSWAEVDAARVVVANTLGITLTDSEPRNNLLPLISPIRNTGQFSVVVVPPEPTWGSWEELNQAWANLDNQWTALNTTWTVVIAERSAMLQQANDAVVANWAQVDAEWLKINAAWADIDAAWAGAQ